MILAPASSCMIRPEVTIGEIPSSIKVPEVHKVDSMRHAAAWSTQQVTFDCPHVADRSGSVG